VDIKQFFYKDWAKRGVYMINDVLDETGKNDVISKVSGHL
jgi:uracil DNA glycosylase